MYTHTYETQIYTYIYTHRTNIPCAVWSQVKGTSVRSVFHVFLSVPFNHHHIPYTRTHVHTYTHTHFWRNHVSCWFMPHTQALSVFKHNPISICVSIRNYYTHYTHTHTHPHLDKSTIPFSKTCESVQNHSTRQKTSHTHIYKTMSASLIQY